MEFRHPKYYKELRKRNKSDQAISYEHSTESEGVRPGPGLKPRYTPTGILLGVDLGDKPQASSLKLQAPSIKLSNQPVQSPSDKHPNQSNKRQASSRK
jgi:hypothetical protein